MSNRILLYVPYDERDKAKLIPTYHWEKKLKKWSFDIDDIKKLFEVFPELKREILSQATSIYLKEKQGQDNQERLTWLSRYKFKRSPYPHQLTCLQRMLSHIQYGLFLDMGLGKTQVAVNFVDIVKKNEIENLKCLIVAPKTILENWAEEIEINSNLNYIILEGSRKRRIGKLKEQKDFYIINYEGLAVLKEQDLSYFDIVILDESSKIKNPSAQRTREVLRQFKDVKYKYALSGTPISQNIIDIYSQMKFLNPDFLGHKSFYSFRNRYIIYGGYGNYEIIGYKDLDVLKKKIRKHSIRLTKKECLKWLPSKIYEKRSIVMQGKMKEQYQEMEKNLILEISQDKTITAPIILTKLLRLQQITSGQFLDNSSQNLKLQELKGLIEDNRGNNNKFVIWVRFVDSLKLIREMLYDMKIKYSELWGEIKDRQEQINNFNTGDNEVMVGQIQTGGLGINLQAGNIVVYYENNFSLQDRLQSEDRSHRIGIKKSVTYLDLVYKDTIDEKIIYAVKNKKEISDYIIEEYKR